MRSFSTCIVFGISAHTARGCVCVQSFLTQLRVASRKLCRCWAVPKVCSLHGERAPMGRRAADLQFPPLLCLPWRLLSCCSPKHVPAALAEAQLYVWWATTHAAAADRVRQLPVCSYHSFQDEHLGCNSLEEEMFVAMLRLTVRVTFPAVWVFRVVVWANVNGYLDSLSFEGLANRDANDVGAAGKGGKPWSMTWKTENRLPGAPWWNDIFSSLGKRWNKKPQVIKKKTPEIQSLSHLCSWHRTVFVRLHFFLCLYDDMELLKCFNEVQVKERNWVCFPCTQMRS